MANGNFIVQNGLQVGPLTIDAATGSISTTGTVDISGGLAVSTINKNDSSITINDTGTGGNISFVIDGVTEHVMTATLTTLNGNLKVNDVGYLQVPAGTNAQRPAGPANGMMRYNSDITSFEGYYAGAWSSLGGVKSVDAKAYITAEASAGAGDDVIRVYAGDSGTSTQVMWASTSNVKVLPTTVSTSSTTGALQVAGGAGVAGALNVGGTVGVTGATTLSSTLGVTGVATLNGNVVAASGTASTNTTTGALVVAGGAGISGALNVGGTFAVTGTSNHTGASNFAAGLTASTVQAGTIGNSGATLTGTISTAAQNNITTMNGLTSLGSTNVDTVAQGNFTVVGNLTIQGAQEAIGTQNLTIADSLIELHTSANLAALTSDDGRDIGIRMHYYKGGDKLAALIWENTSEQLHWYANATETSSNISGTLGTIGAGEIFLANATASSSTSTGALRTAGGLGVAGAAYIGGLLNVASTMQVTGTSNYTGAGNFAGGLTASTVSAGTIGNTGATLTGTISTAAQPNITSVGTLTGLTVSGTILPSANLTVNIGSTSAWFNTFYGISTQAKYADLAENYLGDKAYAPGTVVMFGGDKEVTVAEVDTKAVAGVVSTNPAHLMNGQLTGSTVVALALQGRVPCNVIGPVKKGDLMVSAGFGYAKASADPKPGQVIGKALNDFTGAKGQIEVVVGRV